MALNSGALPARLAPERWLTALTMCLAGTTPALAQVAPPAMLQPAPAQSKPVQPAATNPVAPALSVAAALQRTFSAGTVQPEWFSREFTPVLPKLQEILADYRLRLGMLQKVQGAPGSYRMVYQRGVVTAVATVSAAGIFSSLRIVGETGLAADPATVRALERLYSGAFQPQWFSPEFLAQVPAQQLQPLLTQLAAGLGAFTGVTFDVGYLLNFAAGRIPVNSVATDAQGRFTALLLGQKQGQSTARYNSFPELDFGH